MNRSRRAPTLLVVLALLLSIVTPALATAYSKIASLYDTEVTGAAVVFTASASNILKTQRAASEFAVWVVDVTIKAGSTATTLAVRESDSDSDMDELLNAGDNLVAGERYTFSVLAEPGKTYNFVFGATTRVASLKVAEEGR